MLRKSLIFPVLALAWASAAPLAAGQEEDRREPRQVTLRGEVVDIYAALRERYPIDLGPDIEPLYGFRTTDGNFYTLLKTRRSLALFMDERLRGRSLILQGRVFPSTQCFEATFIQSIIDGVVHDVYYYCDICAITSLTPELCDCCREPVRLVEEPVKSKTE